MHAVATSRRRPESFITENRPVNVLVLGPPRPSHEEAALETVASIADVKGRGKYPDDMGHLTDADWDAIEVVLVTNRGGTGVEGAVERAKNLKWIHSLSAGINDLAVPSVQNAPVVVTNAKGVFSHSLAEYALFACNYFAKNLPRLLASKKERKWDMFEVEELRGQTMGIIGLGDIGMSTAKIAKAFEMNIIGLRRNTQLSEEEKHIIDAVYGPDELTKVMSMSDYIVAALPLTDNTLEFINAEALNAMQSHSVFINLGRGPTVEEPALIKVLQEGRIKGAALDVFYEEPLIPESPFYNLDNVLMSFHNADKTRHFVVDSVSLFKELLVEYKEGKELRNVVDVMKGY